MSEVQRPLQVENGLEDEKTEGRAREGVHRNDLSMHTQEVPGSSSFHRPDNLGHHQGWVLFVFLDNAFLNRATTQSVVNDTGCKAKTAEKYLKIIKNSLFLEKELEKSEMFLGGDGETVQIDESCVFSRKYGVGRVLETTKHGWVFGIIEDKPGGRLYIQMVRSKDAATLKQIIKDHVRDKTTIFTDCWPSYNGLEMIKGYKHNSVNHSEHFVEVQQQQMDPEEERVAIETAVRNFIEAEDEAVDETRLVIDRQEIVHTQRIERSWREVKQELVNQRLDVLRSNDDVATYRSNHLKVSVPLTK